MTSKQFEEAVTLHNKVITLTSQIDFLKKMTVNNTELLGVSIQAQVGYLSNRNDGSLSGIEYPSCSLSEELANELRPALITIIIKATEQLEQLRHRLTVIINS